MGGHGQLPVPAGELPFTLLLGTPRHPLGAGGVGEAVGDDRLDLVALGTVSDIVPLHGENRVLVQCGSLEIARTSRIGLRKLMQVAGVRPPILPEDIGYRLGPRLNAAGRLSTAEKSLQLLLTKDEGEAAALAAELDQQNRERQEVEQQVLDAAIEQIDKQFDAERDAAIVRFRAVLLSRADGRFLDAATVAEGVDWLVAARPRLDEEFFAPYFDYAAEDRYLVSRAATG